MNKQTNRILNYINKELFQIIFWICLIVITAKSNVYPEWKVLYLLIEVMGLNLSMKWWCDGDE